MGPYNTHNLHQKHMSFDYGDNENLLHTNTEQENLLWKRLSELILKESKFKSGLSVKIMDLDKIEMRKFLAHLNNKFYKQLQAKAISEVKKLKRRRKVRNKHTIFSHFQNHHYRLQYYTSMTQPVKYQLPSL